MNEHSPRPLGEEPPAGPGDGIDLARLKAEIRASLARRTAAPGAVAAPAGGFDADLRAASLGRVERHADIGAGVPELPRFRGPLRFVARLLARVVLYLSRFLTSRQREYNYAVLNALRNLHRGLSRLEDEQAQRFQQLRTDLERLVEQRLREEGRRAA
jgi:hypothetical protein